YGSGQPVDLIDEENIAVTELREDRRQITAALQGRTRCDVEFRVHLVGDDSGQGRLSEAGWSGEQQVVRRLTPSAGGLENDGEMLFELGLTDEVVEVAGAEADLLLNLGGLEGFGRQEFVAGHH